VGAHSAPPDPLTGFEGVLLLTEGKGMEGKEKKRKKGEGREGRRGRRGRKGRVEGCVMAFEGDGRPCLV